MDLCFQSLVKSLLFFFSVFSFSFFPPWKGSLTNYDSWVEGLSLFTLQRQTCERQGARNGINVSTVHLIFSLHVWKCHIWQYWLILADHLGAYLWIKVTINDIIKHWVWLFMFLWFSFISSDTFTKSVLYIKLNVEEHMQQFPSVPSPFKLWLEYL